MTECHPGAELDQPGLGRRRRRLGTYPQQPGGPPHQARVTGRISRRDQQQPAALARKSLNPPPEALLDPRRDRCRAREPEPARQLRRRQSSRQLQQRQRVSPGLGDDPVPHSRVQRPGQRRIQQRPRIVLTQALDHELRHPRHMARRVARREDQAHRFCLQAARREPQRLRGGVIEPLLVIDQADQRLLPGCLGQQAQHGQADQEPVRGGPGAEPERGLQRLTLRTRQPVQVSQQRLAQLLQPGKCQLHLGLDARGTDHPAARRVPRGVVQQRALAHPRLAGQHQRLALARPDRADQPVEEAELAGSAPQLRSAFPAGGRCHHLTGVSFSSRRRASPSRAAGPRRPSGRYAQPEGTQTYAPSMDGRGARGYRPTACAARAGRGAAARHRRLAGRRCRAAG